MTRAAVGLCVLAFAALPAPVRSQEPSSSPIDASFTVHTVANRDTFRIGEEIRLELTFRGTGDPNAYFTTSTYDRSGRMWQETYVPTPSEGAEDPLDRRGGFIGGGLSGWHPLDGTPWVLRVSLNEWIRFTKPGRYRVAITSQRLGLNRNSNVPGPILSAAPLDVTITEADEQWQAEECRKTVELVDAGLEVWRAQGRRGVMATPRPVVNGEREPLREGLQRLRHLGTDAAVRAIVERFELLHEVYAWDTEAALLYSPSRQTAIGLMEARLDSAPSLPTGYIDLLTRMRMQNDPPSRDWQADQARASAIEAEYDVRWRRTLGFLPISVDTLIGELRRLTTTASGSVVSRAIVNDLTAHPVEARRAFGALTTDEQRRALETHWASLRSPWLLQALYDIYFSSQGDFETTGAGDLAVRRLLEAEPVETRRLILDEIATGEHHLNYETLAMLPDRTLPGLDDALVARRQRDLPYPRTGDHDVILAQWLIGRYGSTTLMPVVRETLRADHCGSPLGSASLMYLLRTDSSAAAAQLQSCDRVSFMELGRRYWDATLERAALDALNGAMPSDAAQALGAYGSAATKTPLIDRFVRWNREWRDRAVELETVAGLSGQRSIENSLTNALFQNKSFQLTQTDADQIASLCLTGSCRTNVGFRRREIR